MKEAEVIKHVLAGKPVVIVEYRSYKLDTIAYVDKRTGSRVSKPVVKHAIELGDTQAAIAEWLPDGVDLTMVKPQFTKGQRCVLTLQGIEQVQGFASIRGTLEPFEAAAK